MTSAGFAFITIALELVALINLGLGVVVARASRKEENRVFAVLAASVVAWTLTNALFRIAPSESAGVIWSELSYAAAIVTGASFLHLSWTYPVHRFESKQDIGTKAKWSIWLLAAAIGVLAFVPGFFIRSVDLKALRISTGPGVYLLAAYMAVAAGAAFFAFYKNQGRLHGRAQAQARYVLFGSSVAAAIGLLFNLLLPLLGNYQLVWLGPIGSLFFVGFTGYSIAALHLFDVKILIRRTLVYTILLSLLAGVFKGLESILEDILNPLIGGGQSFSSGLISAMAVGLALDPARRYLEKLVSKAVFRGEQSREDR